MPRKIIDMPKGMHFKWRTLDWTPGSLFSSCPWLTCLMPHSKESFLSGHEPTSCGMYAKPAIPVPPVESTHLPWFWNLLSRPNLYILKNEQFFFLQKEQVMYPYCVLGAMGQHPFPAGSVREAGTSRTGKNPGHSAFFHSPFHGHLASGARFELPVGLRPKGHGGGEMV